VYGVGVDLRELRERLRRTLPGQLVERFLELRPIERGLALGSKLFTAVVPAAILLSGLLTSPNAVADRLVAGLGLTGPGAAAIRQLFHAPPSESGTAVGVVGILVLLYSLLSFARALQRLYEDAWRLPPVRTGIVWGSAWLVTFTVYFSMATPFAHLLTRHGLTISAFVVSLIGGAVLWSVTPAILLGRRVPLRALRRGGLATAVLLTLFNVGSRIYVPHSMTANTGRYGLVGVTFTLLTWLFAFCLVLVASAAAGAVLGDTRAAESASVSRPAAPPPRP
jgi:membrane protein